MIQERRRGEGVSQPNWTPESWRSKPVEQVPTYTGPGDLAPRRYYQEMGVTAGWGYRHHYRHHWHHYGYRYHPHVLHSLY